MKRVRLLLRVSSNQQLEADGDLAVQRQIVKEYVERQEGWNLDSKEYFEGSNSGYKNSVADRDVLQEALQDAGNGEYDILAAYKDDRIGRRMWEIGAYVMELKRRGVDIYTVKDGCISPESNDIMGQMVLALRYGNAQKSSADTGARVKDTAQKLAQRGKFMGGAAPYGYQLELSGEISKHGRALHKLVIVPEQAEVVKHIYELSYYKEYGSQKIARLLNEQERYKRLAPNTVWKSGTVAGILSNPIYAGHTAYRRRENVNGSYRRLDSGDWVISFEANEDIRIVDSEIWNGTQEKRRLRREKYRKNPGRGKPGVIARNDGSLALADVAYCGYCGGKLVNGSRYNYWTIKSTGEKRTRKIPIYRCKNARQGMEHDQTKEFRADRIEPAVFYAIGKYIDSLQKNEDLREEIKRCQNQDRLRKEKELEKEKERLAAIRKKIEVLESHVPDAMTGEYPFSPEEMAKMLEKLKLQADEMSLLVRQTETGQKIEDMREKFSSWQDVFLNADIPAKRALANLLVERIDVKKDEIVIRFQISPDQR